MLVAFLDEFGHEGVYINKSHPKHNTSPIFGYGGFIMRVDNIRDFSLSFNRMRHFFIENNKFLLKELYENYEVKGRHIFKEKSMSSRHKRRVSNLGHKLLNSINNSDGRIFYTGMEKYQSLKDHDPSNLHVATARNSIKNISKYATSIDEKVMIIFDQHSVHENRCRPIADSMIRGGQFKSLVEPPHEAISELYNNIQAADWICSILLRIFSCRSNPKDWKDSKAYCDKFEEKIVSMAIPQSSMTFRQKELVL